MAKVGFAIIGLGGIAETHAKVIESLPDCYLAAVCSRKMAKAEEFASRHVGAKAYDEVEYLLEDPDVDIVVVTTPPGEHLRPAELALRAGKHVIVEKPFEKDVERAKELIEIAQDEGVYITCIFQSRFMPAVSVIKEALESGRLGRICLVDAQVKWFRGQSYFDAAHWRGDKIICGGGVLMNQAIHAIDLLLYLVGDPVEVTAYSGTLAHKQIDVEDVSVAIMKFANGSLGVIEATTDAFPGSVKRLELNGSKGTIVLEDDAITRWEFDTKLPEDVKIMEKFSKSSSVGVTSDPKVVDIRYFVNQYKDFLYAISHGTEPNVTGDEAIRSIKLIDAIYRSSEDGRAVIL